MSRRNPVPCVSRLQNSCHHAKFVLLQYRTGLRLLVLTGNLVYTEYNLKSQALLCQDFPLKDADSPQVRWRRGWGGDGGVALGH